MHSFSQQCTRRTFYPDLAKTAALAPIPNLVAAEAPSPPAFPAPLILAPAPKLLQISKARAARSEQR